jgi:short-subunit dehydrogenase
MSIYHLTKQVL